MQQMLNEIRQQPEVVRNILDAEMADAQALADEINRRNIAVAYVAARGTSDNAAHYCKYLLEIEHGIPVAVAAPSVFTVYDAVPHLGPNALVIGISQSGEAPDVIAVVRRAREAGALTACITNTPDSELAQVSEYMIRIGAGEELGIAATKTYTGSLACLALLSVALKKDRPERIEDLKRAAKAMEASLGLDDAIHLLVERYKDMKDCIILGRGYNHCTAMETALKVTETSYIAAQSFGAAGFQHGPIALVNQGFPLVLFAPEGRTFRAMADLANRLREQQHPALICISHDAVFLAGSETAIRVPMAVPEWVSPLVYAVAGQLFAYWLSVSKGLDPDTPRSIERMTKTV